MTELAPDHSLAPIRQRVSHAKTELLHQTRSRPETKGLIGNHPLTCLAMAAAAGYAVGKIPLMRARAVRPVRKFAMNRLLASFK